MSLSEFAWVLHGDAHELKRLSPEERYVLLVCSEYPQSGLSRADGNDLQIPTNAYISDSTNIPVSRVENVLMALARFGFLEGREVRFAGSGERL